MFSDDEIAKLWGQMREVTKDMKHKSMVAEFPTRARPQVITSSCEGIFPVHFNEERPVHNVKLVKERQ